MPWPSGDLDLRPAWGHMGPKRKGVMEIQPSDSGQETPVTRFEGLVNGKPKGHHRMWGGGGTLDMFSDGGSVA